VALARCSLISLARRWWNSFYFFFFFFFFFSLPPARAISCVGDAQNTWRRRRPVQALHRRVGVGDDLNQHAEGV
jgi:hypothetical protein